MVMSSFRLLKSPRKMSSVLNYIKGRIVKPRIFLLMQLQQAIVIYWICKKAQRPWALLDYLNLLRKRALYKDIVN